MQKLITVLDSDSIGVDDLNEYLDKGWEVRDTYSFSKGHHFLIQLKTFTNSTVPLYPGVFYKGSIQLDHPNITEGSMVITKENNAYTISKKQS
jgi:hypothetical protein